MLFSAANINSDSNAEFSDEDSKSLDDALDFDIIDFACLYEAVNPSGALLGSKNGKQYIYPWTWNEAEQTLLYTSLEVVYYHEDKEFTRIAMQECWIALCTQTFETAVDVQFWKNKEKRDIIRILNIQSPITHFIGLEKGVFCLATKQQLVMVNCHRVISGKIINRSKSIRYYGSKLKVVDRKNIITYNIHLKELSRENHSKINLWESLWCGITSAIRSQPNLDTWKKEFANRANAKLKITRERAAILDPCGEALVTFEKDFHHGKLDLQSKGKLLGSIPAGYRWRLRYLSASRQIIVEDYSDLCQHYLDCYELASEESEESEDNEWKGIWSVNIGHCNGLRIHESGNQLFLLTDDSFSILKTSGVDKVEKEVLFRF